MKDNAEYQRWEMTYAEIRAMPVTKETDGFRRAGKMAARNTRSPRLLREMALECMALADYIEREQREKAGAEARKVRVVFPDGQSIEIHLTQEQWKAIHEGTIHNFSINGKDLPPATGYRMGQPYQTPGTHFVGGGRMRDDGGHFFIWDKKTHQTVLDNNGEAICACGWQPVGADSEREARKLITQHATEENE